MFKFMKNEHVFWGGVLQHSKKLMLFRIISIFAEGETIGSMGSLFVV